jgi:CBS domain-containing protein
MATIEKHVRRSLISVDAGATCREAARLMDEKRIGAVAVRDGGRVIGMVTERDLAVRVLGKGLSADLPVREAMRRDLRNIAPDASEADCSDQMRDSATRHLLVEEKNEIIGIISMRDVIQLMLDDKQFLIEQLETYINGR